MGSKHAVSMLRFVFSAALMTAAAFSTAAPLAGRADEIAKAKGMSGAETSRLAAALAAAAGTTDGAPGATRHPVSREACEKEVLAKGLLKGGENDRATCGHPWMSPVPGTDGKVCIDRFEWPNIPCGFPATWTSPAEAQSLCAAEGKRLCDAHEWEASCIGKPQPEDWVRGGNNGDREIAWAYGKERRGDICGLGSGKTPGCDAAIAANKGVGSACGQNTWPSGWNHMCASAAGVYDQHGNAAEHMNLARNDRESGKNGGSGVTEMKGSWFAFPATKEERVHKDDCLWREPGWHRTQTASPAGHSNYHLGFRCCADTGGESGRSAAVGADGPLFGGADVEADLGAAACMTTTD